jgi:hypothetical protein
MKITLLLSTGTVAVLATKSVGPHAGLEPIYSRVLRANECSVKFCHAPYHFKGWCPYESSETYNNISNLEQNLTCGCTCNFS